MKTCAFTVLAAFLLAVVLQRPLVARDPKVYPSDERTESSQLSKHWKKETLTGTLSAVNAAHRIVAVQGKNGASFQFIVSASTKIGSADRPISLANLAEHQGTSVVVTFIPGRSGNLARKIVVSQ